MYSHSRYEKLVEETIGEIKRLSTLKGGEYAGDTDRLANFRRNAERLELSTESIWAVYCNKHIDAINQYCSDIQSGKTRPRLEPITSRADDVIVYMILFKAMVEEREQRKQKPVEAWENVSKNIRTNLPDEDARFEQDSYDKYIRACGRYSENRNNHLSFDEWKAGGKPKGPPLS